MAKSDFIKLIYENPLSCEADVENFRLEGSAKISFENGAMQIASTFDPSLGQAANYVYWCDADFPSDVMIEWKFTPLSEIGLCIMFFAAKAINGQSIFDGSLAERTGQYNQYTGGDINAFHVSYYRTNFRTVGAGIEPALRTCNLRKSKGFHMVAQGGDPIPELPYCKGPYNICIIKDGSHIAFEVDGIPVLSFDDDGKTFGTLLGGGKIGFRQMSPMIASYADLKVYTK